MGALWASLRGDFGSGAADWAGFGGTVWISAGIALDCDWCVPGRGGAGFSGAGGFDEKRWEVAGADCVYGYRQGGGDGGDDCDFVYHRDCAGGVGEGGGEG